MRLSGPCMLLSAWLLSWAACAAPPFSERLAELQSQLSAEPTNTALLFKIGDLCYDEGALGDAKAVEMAEKYFKQLLGLEPRHAMAMALLGSSITMKARDAFWPNVRLRYAKEGVRTIDAAVKLAPENPEVRFVRAENNFHMPKFMDREEIVRSDFDWLWQQAQKTPAGMSTRLKQQVAYYQGLLLKKQKRNTEAVKVWQAGVQFDPQSPMADQIREQLK